MNWIFRPIVVIGLLIDLNQQCQDVYEVHHIVPMYYSSDSAGYICAMILLFQTFVDSRGKSFYFNIMDYAMVGINYKYKMKYNEFSYNNRLTYPTQISMKD